MESISHQDSFAPIAPDSALTGADRAASKHIVPFGRGRGTREKTTSRAGSNSRPIPSSNASGKVVRRGLRDAMKPTGPSSIPVGSPLPRISFSTRRQRWIKGSRQKNVDTPGGGANCRCESDMDVDPFMSFGTGNASDLPWGRDKGRFQITMRHGEAIAKVGQRGRPSGLASRKISPRLTE